MGAFQRPSGSIRAPGLRRHSSPGCGGQAATSQFAEDAVRNSPRSGQIESCWSKALLAEGSFMKAEQNEGAVAAAPDSAGCPGRHG